MPRSEQCLLSGFKLVFLLNSSDALPLFTRLEILVIQSAGDTLYLYIKLSFVSEIE